MINYHIQCGVYGPRSTVFVDKQALNYCSARGHELPIIDHHTMNDDDDYFWPIMIWDPAFSKVSKYQFSSLYPRSGPGFNISDAIFIFVASQVRLSSER